MGKHSKEPEKKNKNKKESKKTNKAKESKTTTTKKTTTKAKVKKKKKSHGLMKTIIFLIILATVGSGVFVANKVQQLGGGLTGFLATILGESQEDLENLKPFNVLIMGVSGVDDYKLADTIMIASYNPQTQKAALMSIPRDTYVGKKDRKTATANYLASYKINSVYRNGTNIPEAMSRISDLTEMELENYIIIDTKALIKLVDAIGGVTFDVPIDMEYDDDSQNLHIDLQAGEQLITGEKAEQLLRFRHNNNGKSYPNDYGSEDLGRMKTQRAFVTETIKQTMKPQNIFKLRRIIDIMNSEINTNLSADFLKKYIPKAVEFNADDLKTDVLSGVPEMDNGVSIMVANVRETKKKVQELFGEEGTDSLNIEKNEEEK